MIFREENIMVSLESFNYPYIIILSYDMTIGDTMKSEKFKKTHYILSYSILPYYVCASVYENGLSYIFEMYRFEIFKASRLTYELNSI